jgi:hypothetical protein
MQKYMWNQTACDIASTIHISQVCGVGAQYQAAVKDDYIGEGCSAPAGYQPEEELNPYGAFGTRKNFEIGEFLYQDLQIPQQKIDKLMDLWAADVMEHKRGPPFAGHEDLLRYDFLPYILLFHFLTRFSQVASTNLRMVTRIGSVSRCHTKGKRLHLGHRGWTRITKSGFVIRTKLHSSS